jgi:hypothetical protein
MSAITDRLGIGDEIRELKLGPTFTSRDNNNSFHTIRCKSHIIIQLNLNFIFFISK